jgi:hypothetical protein
VGELVVGQQARRESVGEGRGRGVVGPRKGLGSGSGDDDDDGDDEGAEDVTEWSYFDEVDLEEEPEWVAAYAALEDSLPDAADGGRVRSVQDARSLLKAAWAKAAVTADALARRQRDGEGAEDDAPPLPFTRQSKEAVRRELYKAFLTDLGTDSRAMGGRHWLDRDALIHLRGLALMCQRPEYADLLAGLTPRFSRGAKLVVPSATHAMQEVLALALAHSVGGALVVADHRRVAAVRRLALDAGVPKRFLGHDIVMGALLDLMRDGADGEPALAGRPLVLFLADKARPFLQVSRITSPSSCVPLAPLCRDPVPDVLPFSFSCDAPCRARRWRRLCSASSSRARRSRSSCCRRSWTPTRSSRPCRCQGAGACLAARSKGPWGRRCRLSSRRRT